MDIRVHNFTVSTQHCCQSSFIILLHQCMCLVENHITYDVSKNGLVVPKIDFHCVLYFRIRNESINAHMLLQSLGDCGAFVILVQSVLQRKRKEVASVSHCMTILLYIWSIIDVQVSRKGDSQEGKVDVKSIKNIPTKFCCFVRLIFHLAMVASSSYVSVTCRYIFITF